MDMDLNTDMEMDMDMDLDMDMDIDTDNRHGHRHRTKDDKPLWSLLWCANSKTEKICALLELNTGHLCAASTPHRILAPGYNYIPDIDHFMSTRKS